MSDDTRQLERLIKMPIQWQKTDDVDFPYRALLDGVALQIRLNDFPDEPLFSLIQEGKHVADFDDWPDHWKR